MCNRRKQPRQKARQIATEKPDARFLVPLPSTTLSFASKSCSIDHSMDRKKKKKKNDIKAASCGKTKSLFATTSDDFLPSLYAIVRTSQLGVFTFEGYMYDSQEEHARRGSFSHCLQLEIKPKGHRDPRENVACMYKEKYDRLSVETEISPSIFSRFPRLLRQLWRFRQATTLNLKS